MSDRIMRAKQLTLSGEDFDNASAGTTANISVYLRDKSGKILLADGLDVPVDTSSGYAKGCLFIDRNVVTGTTGLYENTGTSTSCVFNAIGAITAGEIALATGSLLLGAAGVAAAIDGKTNTNILVGNGTTMTSVALSQDVTMTNAGVVTINSHAADVTVATDKKIYFRDTGLYVYSSANGQLDVIGDTIVKVTAPTTEIASSVGVVLSSASSDTALEISGTATNFGIDISAAQTAVGLGISGTCATGISLTGACATYAMLMTGATSDGIYLNPTMTANESCTPLKIAYNYPGATVNSGIDMDCYGIRSAITQTSSNDEAAIADRGYMLGIRSDITVNGFVDDAYSFYAKATVAGTTTANQIYGLNSVFNHGAFGITLDESGQVAGIGISMNGSGDVTCGGTGFGKVSGMYISWNETNAMTVDTCGIYIGNVSSALLDAGFRINHAGTTVNAFYSYLSGGTITTGVRLDGAHTNAFAFPAEGTAPVETYTTQEAPTGKIKILIGTDVRYLAYWD